MPDRKTSRKGFIHSAFDWIGDHVIGSIRMWRILQSPNASKILAHRSKKVQREAALQKKREEWEERQQRRKKKVRSDRSHELTGALRLQRMRLKDFHRRTPARRLLLLYLAPTIVISLVFTGLFLLAPDHKTKATPLPQRPSAGSEDLEKVMEKTAQLLSENRLEEAEKYLDILNVRAPNDFTVLTYNGAINVLRKNYPAARAAYSKVLEITPGSPVAIYNLADIEFLTGNYAAAERGFLGMLDQQPTDPVLLFRLALCAILQNDTEKTDRFLAKLNPAAPNPAWHYATAARLFADKKPGEANKFVQQARTIYGEQTAFYDKTFQDLGYSK